MKCSGNVWISWIQLGGSQSRYHLIISKLKSNFTVHVLKSLCCFLPAGVPKFNPQLPKISPQQIRMVAPLHTKLCLMPPLLTNEPPNTNKFGSYDHNIWALAVTTLTTKVSTRYIHSPLRWIWHISPPALEINEQQIIYGKSTLCWITVAGDHGDLYRSLTTQIMHRQHLQCDRWLTVRWGRNGCMSLCAVVSVYRNATSIHNLISFPRSKQ